MCGLPLTAFSGGCLGSVWPSIDWVLSLSPSSQTYLQQLLCVLQRPLPQNPAWKAPSSVRHLQTSNTHLGPGREERVLMGLLLPGLINVSLWNHLSLFLTEDPHIESKMFFRRLQLLMAFNFHVKYSLPSGFLLAL